MSYEATVIPIMLASPGDVIEERNIAREVIHEWNAINSNSFNVVLLPVGWETHLSPDLWGRGQELINDRILKTCDLLVGIFWTRLGTPTGQAESGTVEEIRQHRDANKPAMVYFSTKPVAPQSIDQYQFDELQNFKSWCKQQGLIESYDNIYDFRDKFRRHLSIILTQNPHVANLLNSRSVNDTQTDVNDASSSRQTTSSFHISEEAVQLLYAATLEKDGVILNVSHMGGKTIQSGDHTFGDPGDRRSIARWENALDQLVNEGLISDRGGKGEVFQVTHDGYGLIEHLNQE